MAPDGRLLKTLIAAADDECTTYQVALKAAVVAGAAPAGAHGSDDRLHVAGVLRLGPLGVVLLDPRRVPLVLLGLPNQLILQPTYIVSPSL